MGEERRRKRREEDWRMKGEAQEEQTKEEEDGDMEGRKERIEVRRKTNHLPGKLLTCRRNPNWNLKRRRKTINSTNKTNILT